MNTTIILADLETARDRVFRALERAAALGTGGAGLADRDRIADDLRDVRHLIDRAVNEIRFG